MITTAEYINTMKIAQVRELARLVGIKGVPISRTRKAELIEYIIAHLDYDHEIAAYEMKDAFYAMHVRALDTNRAFDALPRKSYADVHQASIALMNIEGKSYQSLSPDARCKLSDRVRAIWDRTPGIPTVALVTRLENALNNAKTEDIDSFLSECESILTNLITRSAKTEESAYVNDMLGQSDIPEQWTTVTKDLKTALHNIKWSIGYRNKP